MQYLIKKSEVDQEVGGKLDCTLTFVPGLWIWTKYGEEHSYKGELLLANSYWFYSEAAAQWAAGHGLQLLGILHWIWKVGTEEKSLRWIKRWEERWTVH